MPGSPFAPAMTPSSSAGAGSGGGSYFTFSRTPHAHHGVSTPTIGTPVSSLRHSTPPPRAGDGDDGDDNDNDNDKDNVEGSHHGNPGHVRSGSVSSPSNSSLHTTGSTGSTSMMAIDPSLGGPSSFSPFSAVATAAPGSPYHLHPPPAGGVSGYAIDPSLAGPAPFSPFPAPPSAAPGSPYHLHPTPPGSYATYSHAQQQGGQQQPPPQQSPAGGPYGVSASQTFATPPRQASHHHHPPPGGAVHAGSLQALHAEGLSVSVYDGETSPFPRSATADRDSTTPTTTTPKAELGKTRCYWALLSAPALSFLYLDPVLQAHVAEQAPAMIGRPIVDFCHPDERERASKDLRDIVESRTLFGSVTRCRYLRVPRIREKLGCESAPTSDEAHLVVLDENYIPIDIVINWVGEGLVLCFFHAIIDKRPDDNNEESKTDWTNWCGTPEGAFDAEQCQMAWKNIHSAPGAAKPRGHGQPPQHVFQVLSSGNKFDILFSWPQPRFLESKDPYKPAPSPTCSSTGANTISYGDGSYFAEDYANLAQGVSLTPGSGSSDARTSCTRRFRAKHTVTTEGMLRSIESVLIPYGSVILACFQTTYQQFLPRNQRGGQIKPFDESHLTAPSPSRQSSTDGSDGRVGSSKKRARDPAWEFGPGLEQRSDSFGGTSPYAGAGGRRQAANAASSTSSGPSVPVSGGGAVGASGVGSSTGSGSVATLAAVAAAAAAQTKSCISCGTSNSPEWRRGPQGHKTLCNACGLRYSRSQNRKAKKRAAGKEGEGGGGGSATPVAEASFSPSASIPAGSPSMWPPSPYEKS